MPRYQLNDPRLQDHLDELAERDTADWPTPDGDQRVQLTRLLAATPQSPARRAAPAPKRRAA